MINNLLKYDLKKMFKILIYIYVITIGLSIITRLINIGKDIQIVFIIGQVFAGLTYSAIASVLVNTFVHILKVFITNLYKDESYLTHTLPVTKGKILLSKYLASLIVIITSVLVCVVSLVIMLYSKEMVEFIKVAITLAVSEFDMSIGLFLFIVVLIIFCQICSMMSMAFMAIIKANTYNTHRVRKGLLWFALYYFGGMYIVLMIAAIVFAIQGNIEMMFASTLSQVSFITLIVVCIVVYIVYAIMYYILANRLFNRGVNVD